MPSWTAVVRLLRRRLVLGVIFAISLTYCALNLFQHEKTGALVESEVDDDPLYFSTDKPYLWQMQVLNDERDDEARSALNGSYPTRNTCRNSIQGKALIVDEQGLVCTRSEVLPSGCCSEEIPAAPNDNLNDPEAGTPSPVKRERHSCQTCNPEGCCAVFEYCVSCCLRPGKPVDEPDSKAVHDKNRRVRKADEGGRADANMMRRRLWTLDRFQVCLATCRTSSASVRHENTYKDPHSKHCYNLPLQNVNSNQRYRRDLNNVLIVNNNSESSRAAFAPSSILSRFFALCSYSLTHPPERRNWW